MSSIYLLQNVNQAVVNIKERKGINIYIYGVCVCVYIYYMCVYIYIYIKYL